MKTPRAAVPGKKDRFHRDDIEAYLTQFAKGTTVREDGVVERTDCGGGLAPLGEQCVCDLVNTATPWTIHLDDGAGPHTNPDNHTVVVHSTGSIFEFGSWTAGPSPEKKTSSNARVLAHELCGHAWLVEKGLQPGLEDEHGGRPEHDRTIMIENFIALEMDGGAAIRGSFDDPHHGESFGRVAVNGYRSGASSAYGLPWSSLKRLYLVAKFMRDNSTAAHPMLADVMGHADRTGDQAVNEDISQRRADSVRRFLMDQGIPGSSVLLSDGRCWDDCAPTPGDNAACRRVEVYVFSRKAASETHADGVAHPTSGTSPASPVAAF